MLKYHADHYAILNLLHCHDIIFSYVLSIDFMNIISYIFGGTVVQR